MPPLSRPRRRRMLLMNESPIGNEVVEPAQAEIPSSIARTAGTMQQQFLEDCGVPEGFEVQISVQGRPEVHTVHVDAAFTFLGRDEECGVRLAGAEIGRHHAYLQAVAGQFMVVDLGSRTGIRQNGRAVRAALLSPGETIELGPYTLRVSNDARSDFHDLPTDSLAHRGNPPIALAFVNQSKPIDPWTLDTPATLIGSAKPCRIRLEHATVTPQHAAIIRGFTRWWIVDLNSQAGTNLDDRPVPFGPLKVGSRIRLGRFQIEIQRPKVAESVVQAPIFDEGNVHTPSAARTPSLVNVVPTMPMADAPAAAPGPQVVNEHLVLELFKEFAALHERTVSQMQQSFREMLEVATTNRTALPAPPAAEMAAPDVATEPAPAAAAAPEPVEELEPSLTDLMHSDDPEERAAAQELLAAQMRSLDAKLRGEREGIAKRLLRSLSLTK
ncbi:FHA domain protein [Caulifigura coniformis]|uniref:FHA domain protein n=1 Tax=Caulifigura coniformis TaxID=2527983 RepID=A0A517SFP8_9PLAN|nr:FHA domain-containing protein [Caulifigura coniformis]QDT54951.1 FHA domain protein [Caulifigura coniformis]